MSCEKDRLEATQGFILFVGIVGISVGVGLLFGWGAGALTFGVPIAVFGFASAQKP